MSVERAKNAPLEYYTVDRNDETKGLLQYMLKPQESQDGKDSTQFIEKAIKEGYVPIHPTQQVLIRLYVQYTSPFVITANLGGKDQVSMEEYTFNHIATFENQLRLPPVGSTTYLEFVERQGNLTTF